MKARSIAIKGMLILLCIVLVCLFFSGTIKTIVTPKVQFVTVKTGKLTHHYQFTGKVTYPGAEDFSYTVSQPVIISQTSVRPGDKVKAGDTLFSMRFSNQEAMASQLEVVYQNALIAQMEFELTYADYHPDPRATEYMSAYSTLQMATIYEGEARLAMERVLPAGVIVPEEGYPEGADETATKAIDAWRSAYTYKASAKSSFDRVSADYVLTESDRQYLVREQETLNTITSTGAALNAFYAERDAMSAVCAPRDGYIAAVNVRTGSSYDGSMPLYSLTDAESMPVIEIGIDEMDRIIPDGTTVMIMTQWGDFKSEVLVTGVNDKGDEYAHIAIPDDLAQMGVSINRFSAENFTVSLALQTDTAHSLVPVSAIHGTGDDRYVYVVEENSSALGGTEMSVTKLSVTVIDEADGMAAVKERLTRVQLAYMEDRPLSDGATVMGDVQ
ncbi:MAG: hypothetical protein J6M20_04315 [Clostridia bacterium]|nr:hypothetical protein [Clostridia bacterium]